jgi:hypothetical protein
VGDLEVKIEEFDLKAIKYKRGWLFYLEKPNDECPVYKLMIVSNTKNSYNEDEDIRVRHEFMVPPADYTETVWLAWIFDRVRDVEANHEAGEFFKYHDVRVFAPHHGNGQDPYRVWFVGDYQQTRTRAGDDDPS